MSYTVTGNHDRHQQMLKYLNGTVDLGLEYSRGDYDGSDHIDVDCYANASHADNVDTRRSSFIK